MPYYMQHVVYRGTFKRIHIMKTKEPQPKDWEGDCDDAIITGEPFDVEYDGITNLTKPKEISKAEYHKLKKEE